MDGRSLAFQGSGSRHESSDGSVDARGSLTASIGAGAGAELQGVTDEGDWNRIGGADAAFNATGF